MPISPSIKRNLSLAWPLAINALLMQSMLMIDTLLISPLGEMSLAAMGIASTIVAFFLGIQMALANGTQLVISRAVGCGRASALANAFWPGLAINTLISGLFWLCIVLFEHSMVRVLTTSNALHNEVSSYLSIAKYLIIFTALTQVLTALFNGLGKTKIPLKGYLIEMPINAVMSYFLIHGYLDVEGFGLQGAAIGSLISILIRLAYLSLVFFLDKHIHLPKQTDWGKQVFAHFSEIFPVAVNVIILSIGATIYQLLYSQLSIHSYAAITIIMPWLRSGSQFITAWAHSSAITLSQAIGAGKQTNLKKNVSTSINIAIVISLFTSLLFLFLSSIVQRLYPDMDPSTYTALAIIAPLYIFLPIIRGYNTVHGHILRALGKTTSVFKINFIGQWAISIPLCALLILHFDCSIFWAFAVQPIEEIIKAYPFRHLAKQSLDNFDHSVFKRYSGD